MDRRLSGLAAAATIAATTTFVGASPAQAATLTFTNSCTTSATLTVRPAGSESVRTTLKPGKSTSGSFSGSATWSVTFPGGGKSQGGIVKKTTTVVFCR